MLIIYESALILGWWCSIAAEIITSQETAAGSNKNKGVDNNEELL